MSEAVRTKLWARVARKNSNRERIAKDVARSPEQIDDLLAGLAEEKPELKYGCSRVLRALADVEPEVLYPWFEVFAKQLEHANKIFQWDAIYVIAALASVDDDRRVEKILDRYLAKLDAGIFVTASNTIKGVTRIALAKPKLTSKICEALFVVEKVKYQAAQCRQIALGHVIDALDRIALQVDDPKELVAFVKRRRRSSREPTKKKAERTLRRWERTLGL